MKANKADLEWLIELQQAWSKNLEIYIDSILMRDVIRELIQLRRQASAADKLANAARNMFKDLSGDIDEYNRACEAITEDELDSIIKEIITPINDANDNLDKAIFGN